MSLQSHIDTLVHDLISCTDFESRVLLTKFAGQLITECATLTLDYKNPQHYQGWLDYRDEIKQHFGVQDD